MQPAENYERFHNAYVFATGMSIPLTMPRIYCWEAFSVHGFTPDDVATVVKHLRSKIKAGRKWPSCLLFSNLIRNTDEFSEQLCEANAMARAPKPHPAHRELTVTGRPAITEKDTTRSAAQILAGEEALKKLIALKNSL